MWMRVDIGCLEAAEGPRSQDLGRRMIADIWGALDVATASSAADGGEVLALSAMVEVVESWEGERARREIEGVKKRKKRNSVGAVVRHKLPRFFGKGNNI